MTILENPKNAWRLEAPERDWVRSPDPGAPGKYLLVTCDAHATEPTDFLTSRMPAKYHDRLPHIEVDEDGAQWLIVEGWQRQLVKPAPGSTANLPPVEEFEDFEVLMPYTSRMESEDIERSSVKPGVQTRLANLDRDGVDYEITFPMKGLCCFATSDPTFGALMCHAWNEWALEEYGSTNRIVPMAMVDTAEVDTAIREVQWAAEHGFKGVLLPNRPEYGPVTASSLQFNDRRFDPLWAAIAETGLVITFHVSTGSDPRATGGDGGAIINYMVHCMTSPLEPLAHLLASGVFVRHPTLRAGTVESGCGWVPWTLEAMDYAYRAHHMWVRPVLPEPPSTYYRSNCFSTFVEDPTGLRLVEELDLTDNFVWSNDYPHHEGSWPHSAQSIRRQMGNLSEIAREKLLGLNAARIFDLPVPAERD